MPSAVFDRLSLLSEPMRVRLLRVLEREELGVGEVAKVVQTSQPTVSRHLKQLLGAGFVSKRKAGTSSLYRMANGELPAEARALWQLVSAEVEADAADPTSQLAEDLRRLETVLAQRSVDSEQLFATLGSRWDGVRRELFGDSYVLPALLSLMPPNQVVADLGCGTGAVLPALATAAQRVIGIDREAAMLDVARERVAAHPNVALHKALLDALPLDNDSVDLALCELVLHHVAELAPVFAEVGRVLRTGGRFVLVDMVEHDRSDFQSTMGHRHPGFSREQIEALGATEGLRLVRWTVLPPDPQAQGPGLFIGVLERGNAGARQTWSPR